MKLFRFLVDKGHMTRRGADALGLIGVGIIWGTAYFFEEWSGFWFWALALLGGALGYVGAYGGLAKQFGFQAPFTNDPLGWRAAKKSYKNSEPSKEEKDEQG